MIRPAEQPASRKPPRPPAQIDLLGRDAWRAIRRKARRLVARGGFAASDLEDLEQELAISLWRGLPSYDPALGSIRSFIATILHRAAATLWRSRSSQRRGNGLVYHSLDVTSDDAAQSLEEAMTSARSGATVPHDEAFDLAHDVALVIETLPPELKRVACQLKRLSVTEVAECENLSRSTVYARIRALRAYFAEAGFGKNLVKSSYTSGANCEGN